MRRCARLIGAFLLLGVVLAGGVGAFSGRATVNTQSASPPACPTTTEDEHESVARRWHEEALNQGNLAVIDEIVAPDVLHRSVTFTDLTGAAGVKQNLGNALASFPDIAYTIEDVITEADRVVVRWRAEGTHLGEFQGIPPTGRRATWTGVNIYRFACGRIAEVWTEVDGMGRLRQLGALPAPGTPTP